MTIRWSVDAISDLARLHDFLHPVAPDAAARLLQQLGRAPHRLVDFPRLGRKLESYEPREVRRLIVGDYEMRYEIEAGTITVLHLWHCRENREP
jgi:plasmid stabilization system protein ParE